MKTLTLLMSPDPRLSSKLKPSAVDNVDEGMGCFRLRKCLADLP